MSLGRVQGPFIPVTLLARIDMIAISSKTKGPGEEGAPEIIRILGQYPAAPSSPGPFVLLLIAIMSIRAFCFALAFITDTQIDSPGLSFVVSMFGTYDPQQQATITGRLVFYHYWC